MEQARSNYKLRNWEVSEEQIKEVGMLSKIGAKQVKGKDQNINK